MSTLLLVDNNYLVTMWFTCSTCHKTYSHRSNLRRHIKSAHLNYRISCKYCDVEFKRKGYLERHITSIHKDIDTFAQIRDCVDSGGAFSTTRSVRKEDTPMDLADNSDSDITDFLDSLWNEASSPVTSLPKQNTRTCTVSTSTMHTRKQISIST